MKRIDRYILVSYLGPMVLTFFVVLFVLMLQFLWLYIDELVGKGLGMLVVAEFIFWGAITFIPLALPLSTMLASIMTMGDFGENNELLAMKAAGMSVQRIMRPLMGMAVLICVGAFFVSNYFIPMANLKINSLMYDIRNKREEIKIPAGMFYNGLEDYSLRIERQDPKTQTMYNVIVYDHTAKKGNVSVTRADSGYIRFTADKEYLIFKLFNGHTYENQETQNLSDTSAPFQRRFFTEQEVLIPLNGYDFKRSDNDDLFKGQAQMQSILTLTQQSDSLKAMETEITKNFISSIYYKLGFMRGQELDTTARRSAQYIYTLNCDSLFRQASIDEKMDLSAQALDRAKQGLSQIDMHLANFEQYDYSLRRVDIEWHRKFTLSIACLIFFFIGAPLGAIIRKGGLGMPVVVSSFFFIIYWVVDISGKKLSRDDVWSPAMGIWLSSFVLLPIGIFLTYKATTDSALFNTDRYLNVLNKLTSILNKKKKRD